MMKNILAFSASNSHNSINRQLLHVAISKIEGHHIHLADIRDYPMPLYSGDEEQLQGFPDAVKKLSLAFLQADAFVIAIPEHNGSMPAVFKNTIDWLSRFVPKDASLFGNKPVLLLSTSPGVRGGSTNLQTLRQIMPYWGAVVSGTFSLGDFYQTYVGGNLVPDQDHSLNTYIQQFSDCLLS